ncbi:MAG: tyrosine-type recombinase/integrase [Acidobacteriota bacterium]
MPQLPVEVLSTVEVERLIAHPDPEDVFGLRDVAILATLYYAAATASEISSLDIRDVDREEGEVRFHTDGGRRRRAPLQGEFAEILNRYLADSRRLLIAQGGVTHDQEVPAVFITNRGHRIHVQDVRQILGAHSKAAGLKSAVNLNTLRLSRAWHMREAGEPPEAIQRLLGAASRSGRRVV